jgi:hypothetical protein
MISARIWPSPRPIFVHQSFVSVFRCSSLSSSASSAVLCGCKNIWGSKSRSNGIVSLPELRDNATCLVIPSTLATLKRKRISRKDPLTPDLSPTKKLRLYGGQGVHGLFSEIKICSQLVLAKIHAPRLTMYHSFCLQLAAFHTLPTIHLNL